jgi:hypothetical protein
MYVCMYKLKAQESMLIFGNIRQFLVMHLVILFQFREVMLW